MKFTWTSRSHPPQFGRRDHLGPLRAAERAFGAKSDWYRGLRQDFDSDPVNVSAGFTWPIGQPVLPLVLETMGGFHPSFEALLKRLACDYESSRPGRSQRPRHHFLIKHLYDISVTLWMGNARMLLGLPAGEHAEGPTVARAMARSRSASSSARRRAAHSVESTHPPSTTLADRATATAAHNAEDQLRREEHALCTASGHADPESTVFHPLCALSAPPFELPRGSAPSPRDVTAVTTDPLTAGSRLPVSCLLGSSTASLSLPM